MKDTPPKWANRFLEWYCNPRLLEEIQGDAHELFLRDLKTRSRLIADRNFIWNTIRFFRWSNIKRSSQHSSSAMMYKNYLSVFRRSFIKQKGYSFLNIAGLAIGIACFLLISLYIRDELRYDRFHEKADRIVRMHEIFESDGVGERSASQPFPVAEAMLTDYGDRVENAVRFFNFQAPTLALATTDNQKEFNESKIFFADSTLFDVFDFPIVKGDKHALDLTHSIVLTEDMATKYFGQEEAIGKYLKFQGTTNLLVTGVIKNVPDNAHFQFDFLVSFATLKEFYNGQLPTTWYWNPCWTYLLLKDKDDVTALKAGMPDFVKKYFPEFIVNDVTLEFIPLTDIHLKSHMDYEIQPNNRMSTLYVFGSIAFFVLIIACINFINLSTARAARRAKEVGMRKTLGSHRFQIIGQFLFESILLCVLAVVVAVVLVAIALPAFNTFAEKNIAFTTLLERDYIMVLVFLPIAVGLMAGVYPAFVLSSFKPITALKLQQSGERGASFRKALVVLQFSLSIILLIGTGVSLDQLNMLQQSDPGFTKENMMMIPVLRSPVANNYEGLRNEFLRNPHVHGVTALEEIVGAHHQVGNYHFEGLEESKPFPRLNVRLDFLKTFNIPLVAGRDYAEEFVTDDSLALLVNESLVKQMGWKSNEEAIGKKFSQRGERRIVGVVRDFNFASRHEPIRPLVLDLNQQPQAFNLFIKYMAVRIDSDDMPGTIAWMQQQWKAQMPGWPFEYFFLENNLDNLYKNENKLSRITLIFSGLSMLVACLGLFALSTFTAEQRKKEMSIRKVLGSNTSQIFMLFSARFFVLIFVANIIAWPVAYFIMKQWLNSFAYKVDINPLLFIIAAVSTIAIAFLTISYQSLRTARTNPAEVLKNE